MTDRDRHPRTPAHAVAQRLHDKVILVVGATSGIGRAVAVRVAAEGAAVMLAGRREDLGRQAAAHIEHQGGRAAFVRCDATVEAEVAAAVAHAESSSGTGWYAPYRSSHSARTRWCIGLAAHPGQFAY